MSGHRMVKYACGEHVESQCRCMDHRKLVIIGVTPCPTCNPSTAPIRTARELLARYNWLDAGELAARVEMVLDFCNDETPPTGLPFDSPLGKVRRILDGEKT